jgi:hypothetical protein
VTATAPQTTKTSPPAHVSRAAPPRGRPTSRESRSWVEILQETAPLIDAPAFFGPPIIFVLGPWLLVAFLLIGPFMLMITVLLVLALAAGLLAACALVLASPFLLIRRRRARSVIAAQSRGGRRWFRTDRVGSGRPGPAPAYPIKDPSHA